MTRFHAISIVAALFVAASYFTTEAQSSLATGADNPPAATVRSRLRKTPELVLTIDMEPITQKGDRLGAPVDAAFSPDGKYLAVGGKFSVIRFFDAKTGKFICRRPEPRPALGAQRTLVWVDNRYCVASGSEHAAYVWDAQNDFRCVKAFRATVYESQDLAWSPKRRLIACAQMAGIVSVWNFDAAPKGGDKGVMGFGDRTVGPEVMAHCIFVPQGGEGAIAVQGVAWSPDGMQIAAVSRLGLDILDASGKGPIIPVNDSKVMHKNYWKKSISKEAPVRDMPLVKRIPVPAGDAPVEPHAYRVDWSADGKLVAAGYGVRKIDAHKHRAAHASTPARIRLFDSASWKIAREWEAHKVRVYALKFSPDGSVLASGGQKEVFLWDPATGEKLMTFPLHDDEVTCTRWSDDGKLLITCAGSERHDSPTSRGGHMGQFIYPGKDKKLRIWRVAD